MYCSLGCLFNIYAGKDLKGVLFCTSIPDDKCTCGSTRVCSHMQAARVFSNLPVTGKNATENGVTEEDMEVEVMPVTENNNIEENREPILSDQAIAEEENRDQILSDQIIVEA
jgi:hypothetical protein